MLPPDIQEQVAKRRGIGAAAPENNKKPAPEEAPVTVAAEPEKSDLECKSVFCTATVPADAAFCPKCGHDQLRGGLIKKLGIEPFDDNDIQDYIFRGYVVREIKVMGKHTLTVRSSQAKDLKEIDSFIMNGSWSKGPDGKTLNVSDFFLRQMNALALTAMSVQKVDGQSIGTTLEDRIRWLEERGAAFVDLIAQKTSLFNQALSDHLKKEDSISGS
jgi:ribosomal protein L40E